MREYSRGKLTYPADKLSALSGLARDFQSRLDDEYAAGLWKGDLHLALLWHTQGEVSRPSEYRAPSWSWASVDGAVAYPGFGPVLDRALDSNIAVFREAVAIPVVADDPFGPIKGGHLRVASMIRKVVILAIPGPPTSWRWRFSIQRHKSGEQGATTTTDLRLMPEPGHGRAIVHSSVPIFDWSRELFFMYVVGITSSKTGGRVSMGLVLSPVAGEVGVVYEKLGTFVFKMRKGDRSNLISGDEAGVLPSHCFESRDEEGRYVIRII